MLKKKFYHVFKRCREDKVYEVYCDENSKDYHRRDRLRFELKSADFEINL